MVSDGSTDGTAGAAAIDPRVGVLVLPRVGKATALNEGIAATSGEVVVFTDANSRLAPMRCATLVRPFADPASGASPATSATSPDGAADGRGTAGRASAATGTSTGC